jgi:hypothetical protein
MVAAVLLSAALNGSALPTDPYVIFDRARSFWASQHYPSVVDYTVHVVATDAKSTYQQRHYHEFWNAASGTVVVQPPVSDEQLADPYKPSGGFNFSLFGATAGGIGGPGSGVKGDLFDVPALAPNYSFGIVPSRQPDATLTPSQLVAEIRREYHDPAPEKVAQLEKKYGLKTIALVVSTKRDYAITLDGIEPLANHQDYHLSMKPLVDPRKYRLRDVWIDTSTYATDRLRVAGNFTDTAMEAVPWLVNLQQIGGATYITNERAEAPLEGYRGRMYDAFAVSFENVGNGTKPFWLGGSQGGGSLSEP